MSRSRLLTFAALVAAALVAAAVLAATPVRAEGPYRNRDNKNAEDLSEGTKQKLLSGGVQIPERQTVMFSRDEMGRMFGRELIGIVGIIEKGFASAVWSESERLKGLRNTHR